MSEPQDGALPPADPSEFPEPLREALARMSQRGPVVDMGTGQVVAQGGRMVANPQDAAELVACNECARAIGLGWWGSTARHPAPDGAPVCVLCLEGEAVHTAAAWFAAAAQLVQARTADGQRRTWRDDAIKGLGAISGPFPG
ncbi:hypothetical protein [Actinacidiphila sp. bgisy160]|uniref:hypothetical protein n=1 Tax=Actinacidiphila sp. bgisy160 TaxID=3413796 RepID=UPI003D74BAE0